MTKWVAAGGIAVGLGVLLFALDRMVKREAERLWNRLDTPEEQVVVRLDELVQTNSEDIYDGSLFDCPDPECRMPAEVSTYVTMFDPDTGQTITYVVINCPADHDLITVTEDWFVDHVISQNQD